MNFIESLARKIFRDQTNIFWKNRNKCLKHEEDKFKLLYYVYLYKCKKVNRKLNSGIPISKNINKFIAPHGLSGIYVSKDAKIGSGCVIFHQVTIGSNNLEDSKSRGAPVIRK